jgi:hypothetical protein
MRGQLQESGQNQQKQGRRGERDTGRDGQTQRGLVPPPGYSVGGRDILPDLGSRRGTMSRASGLESSAAYDMRSLGKHIDLVSSHLLH